MGVKDGSRQSMQHVLAHQSAIAGLETTACLPACLGQAKRRPSGSPGGVPRWPQPAGLSACEGACRPACLPHCLQEMTSLRTVRRKMGQGASGCSSSQSPSTSW